MFLVDSVYFALHRQDGVVMVRFSNAITNLKEYFRLERNKIGVVSFFLPLTS